MTGSGGSLCATANTVDCSGCEAGYHLIANASTGLQNCMMFACSTPALKSEFEIMEWNLSAPYFNVSATCGTGYIGEAVATSCTASSPNSPFEYGLFGCVPLLSGAAKTLPSPVALIAGIGVILAFFQ